MAEFGHPMGAVAARVDCARPAPPENVRHTDAFVGGVGHGHCLGRHDHARAGDSQMAATPRVVRTSELDHFQTYCIVRWLRKGMASAMPKRCVSFEGL